MSFSIDRYKEESKKLDTAGIDWDAVTLEAHPHQHRVRLHILTSGYARASIELDICLFDHLCVLGDFGPDVSPELLRRSWNQLDPLGDERFADL